MLNASQVQTEWSPNFIAKGLTTIIWGTEGVYTSYIVVSASERNRVEEINIEQGSGFEAVVLLLKKGLDLELEVIDDTAVEPPTIGTIVTFSTPYGSIPMLMVTDNASQARKREGMKTFTFKSYNAITGLH
jgi:hypothetical protein